MPVDMPKQSTTSLEEDTWAEPLIDFAIITAIEGERKAVCDAFGLSDKDRAWPRNARTYWRGRVSLKQRDFYEIVVTELTDQGNPSAVASVMDTIYDWQPNAVLLVGVAGAGSVEQRLGDLVIATEIFYYERGKVGPDGKLPEPHVHRMDATLLNRAKGISMWQPDIKVRRPDGTFTLPKIYYGVVASGEKVIADAAARDEIHSSNRKILAIEMEGYGVAEGTWQQPHPPPLMVIRGLSDMADSSKNKEWQPYAAAVAADFARFFISDKPLVPRNREKQEWDRVKPSGTATSPGTDYDFPRSHADADAERTRVTNFSLEEKLRILPEPVRPASPEDFVDRQEELAYFREKLTSGHLAFIGGLPGIGKTSLASKLALQCAEPDRIFWHSFKEKENIDALRWKFAVFLAWNGYGEPLKRLRNSSSPGAAAEPLISFFSVLIQTIRNQGYLFCIDNLHFAEQDPHVNELIELLNQEARRGGISIIATSRQTPNSIEALGVEQLHGLTVPDILTLFKTNGIQLADIEAQEIQGKTGGNPLLLRLAVLALKGKAVAQVLIGLRNAPDIRKFFIQEIDEGLNSPEPDVMKAVAALPDFRGTIEEIELSMGRTGVEPNLLNLRDRYLLKWSATDYAYEEEPFLAEFFYGRIERQARIEMHRRLAQYYEIAPPDLLKAAFHYERAGETVFAAELALKQFPLNLSRGKSGQLRPILETLQKRALPPTLDVQVSLTLGQLYNFIGESQLAEQAFETAQKKSQLLADEAQDHVLKADIYLAKGEFYEQNKDPRQSLEWFSQGLSVLGDLDPERKGAFYVKQSSAYIALGEYEHALEALTIGQPLLREMSHWFAKAEANRGIIASEKGDFRTAAEHHRQTIKIGEQLEDNVLIAKGLNNLSVELASLGERLGENESLERLRAISDILHNPKYQWASRNGLAVYHIERGEYAHAETLLTEANEIAQARKLEQQQPYSLTSLADLHIRMENPEQAVPLLRRAEELALQVENEGILPEIYYNLGLALYSDNNVEARLLCNKAIEIAHNQEQTPEEGKAWRALGQILAQDKEFSKAYEAFEASLKLLTSPYEIARTKTEYARAIKLHTASGTASKVRAGELLAEAQEMFQTLGADKDLDIARELAAQ